MSSAAASNKGKAGRGTKTSRSVHSLKSPINAKIPPNPKAAEGVSAGSLKQAAEAQIAAATELLAQAMSDYAASAVPGARQKGGRFADFSAAYASFVRAVPRRNRLALLRLMRKGIDEAARTELNIEPAELAVPEKNTVTTADFMASLERQQKEQRTKDIEEQRLLPGAEMRARLGVSAQALSAALKAKRMFVFQGPSGEYYYPAFFADPMYDRPVLEKVCKTLGDLPAGSKWDFLTSPRISLAGKTPLDALSKGKLDAVMAAAKAFAEE